LFKYLKRTLVSSYLKNSIQKLPC